MNRETLLKFTEDAGGKITLRSGFGDCRVVQFYSVEELERFAALVAAQAKKEEREECAKVCAEISESYCEFSISRTAAAVCYHAIRKRGEQ